MDKLKVISYIENSFLNQLVTDSDVTDISFNGVDIYYVSNTKGRLKSSLIVDNNMVRDFIRQIANLCESQFSYSAPVLDISVGRYRVNAIHQSIAKVNDDGVITFSIRIASKKIKITDSSSFFTPQIVNLINELLSKKLSIVIGGVTSSGKTEFQKYLLSKLNESQRVIVIDNVLELDQIRNEKIDLSCWQCDEKNPNAAPGVLIKNALRNNPDWLILAESRDKEMVDVLNSAMTGMPIITTLHSLDVLSMPHRMGRMMMKSEQKIDYQEALHDIFYHFHFFFYLNKEIKNGSIQRYISQICYCDSQGNQYILYEKTQDKDTYYKMPESCIDLLGVSQNSPVYRTFIGEGN